MATNTSTPGSGRLESDSSCEPWFQHRPLEDDNNRLRLVKILPPRSDANDSLIELVVEHHGLGDDLGKPRPEYIALSYIWGSEEDMRVILMHGLPFKIRNNLHGFLIQTRNTMKNKDGSVYYWIDSLCINQERVKERNHQVQVMAEIYGRAHDVLVWLGGATDDSARAMELLKASQGHQRENFADENPPKFAEDFWSTLEPDDLNAVLRMFARPYWSRVWIVQELYHAKRFRLLCGSSGIRLRRQEAGKLFTVTWNLCTEQLKQTSPSELRDLSSQAFQTALLLGKIFQHGHCNEESRESIDWRGALMLSVKRGCQEFHDLVFGIQTLFDPSIRINVDYNLTNAELYDALVKTLLLQTRISEEHREGALEMLRVRLGLPKDRLATQQSDQYAAEIDEFVHQIKYRNISL